MKQYHEIFNTLYSLPRLGELNRAGKGGGRPIKVSGNEKLRKGGGGDGGV